MKSFIKLSLVSLMAVVLLGGCKKDGDGGGGGPQGSGTGTFIYDGDTFEVNRGTLKFYGDIYDETLNNFDIELYKSGMSGEPCIYFEILTSANELAAGTYTYKSSLPYQSGTFISGTLGTGSTGADIGGGTLTIAKTGDTYTISYNCTTYGGPVTGSYTGTLKYSDKSD